ncbi:hypothetical protein DFJ73DRAFT_213750 [Zopfochytrium polystomum]|nr:hypothetical protein DFJ73DRAFT_213750 [Zopfochytrium polystomum]
METALSRSFDSGSDDAFDGDDDDNEGSEVRKLESSKGRDDEEDFFSHKSIQQRLKELAFSLLFLMVHGNKSHHIFDFFGIVIEDFQLFIFFVGSDVYMGFELPPGLRNLAGGVDHNHMQMSVYTPMLILSAIGVLFMVANVMFVAYGVITGHQRLIWPIRTLRVCAKTLSTVCFLPIFECLVSVVACNRVHDGTADDVDNLNNLSCSSPGRQAKLAVACVALLFYIPISVSVTSVFYEFNPALKGPANKSHGRVDTIYLLLKASTIIVYKFLPDSAYLAKLAFAILVCLAMFCCTNYFYPNYDIRINQERAGVYLAAFSSGLVVFLGSCYYANTGMVANYGVLVCLLLALVAGFLLGFWLTGLRYQRIQKIVESRMEALSSGLTVDEADYLVFDSWPCVEIAARVFTAHMDERRTSFKLENIAKLRAIFNRGLHEFPEEPMIRIQYSYYLFILSRNDIETTSLMAKVREAPLDVQFRIYYFNQISDQNKEANFLGLNVKLDVASYADYQKTDKDAKLNHYLAVQEMKHLYKLIRDKDFKLEDLSAVTVRLYMHAQRAQEAYVKLASQFPKSKSIMRYFARFCYDVTKDQIRGDNLTYYADELENRRETDDRKKLQPMQPDTRIDTSASDVGRSDTGSSYVTRRAVHVAQRQREARMRSRRLQVNLLFIFKTVGILALWVANFYVVLNLLQISQSSLTRLTWQADRKIYIATSFLRIRQMEAAKNEAEYEVTRSKFQEEMRNLSYIFREIFLNREESDSLENAYDTQNMFTMYFSGYPTVPILIPINTSVFHYTEVKWLARFANF